MIDERHAAPTPVTVERIPVEIDSEQEVLAAESKTTTILPGPPFAPKGADEYANALLRRIWITKGVRFEGARRLETKQRASDLTISLLSVYVIAFTLLQLLARDASTGTLTTLFPLVTIIAPILILVLSQHESGKQYRVFADRMLHSAHQIEALYSHLEYLMAFEASPDSKPLDEIRTKYEEIMRDTALVQDQIDYQYYQSLHPDKFRTYTWWKSLRRHVYGRVRRFVDVWAVLIVIASLAITTAYFPVKALFVDHQTSIHGTKLSPTIGTQPSRAK